MNETVSGNKYHIGVDLAIPGSERTPAFVFSHDSNSGIFASTYSTTWAYSSLDDVYNLFFQGKTIKDNGDEYLDVIMRLPNIDQNQLDAVETLEFFRRQFFPDSDEK